MVKSNIFKICTTKYKVYNNIYIYNVGYVYVFCYILYILFTDFKNAAFNHPSLFYISYSSRLVTFNITNLEF